MAKNSIMNGYKLNQLSWLIDLIDNIPDLIVLKDTNGIYLNCNLAFAELIGKSKKQIIGKKNIDLFPQKIAREIDEKDNRILREKKPYHSEINIKRNNGDDLLFDMMKTLLYDENNELIGILGISRNITERKKLETSLIESKNQMKAILDNIPYFAWLKDAKSAFITVNEPLVKNFKVPLEEIIGKTDVDFFTEKYYIPYIKDDKEVMKTKKQKSTEEVIYTPEGEKWFETYKAPIFDENGKVVGTTGLSREITERKLFEQELLLRDKLLSAVSKASNELVIDPDFNIGIKKSLKIIGKAVKADRAYVFKNFFDEKTNSYVTSQCYEWSQKNIKPQIDNPELQNIPFDFIEPFMKLLAIKKPFISLVKNTDNKIKAFLNSQNIKSIMIFPIFIENEFWGFVGFDDCQNEKIWSEAEQSILSSFAAMLAGIIERNQKREQGKANERRIGTILNNIKDGILTVNKDCIIESCNPAITHMYEYSATEIIGKPIDFLIENGSAYIKENVFDKDRNDFFSNLAFKTNETIAKTKDGNIFYTETEFRKIKLESQKAALIVIRDITQRKEVDRLKNEFISTVSHELRTPLTSIRGSLGLVSNEVAGILPEKAKELVNIALKNSLRLIGLINDFLDIEKMEAGKLSFKYNSYDLKEIVEESIKLNHSFALQNNIDIRFNNNYQTATVYVDKDRLIQVITNLLSNAIKFSSPDNNINVAIIKHNGLARVSIIDNGIGINKDFQTRIFQKFAQADSSDTRKKGGSGLGLSICKAIIEEMGGRINYNTQLDVGSEFYFDLPEFKNDKVLTNAIKEKV